MFSHLWEIRWRGVGLPYKLCLVRSLECDPSGLPLHPAPAQSPNYTGHGYVMVTKGLAKSKEGASENQRNWEMQELMSSNPRAWRVVMPRMKEVLAPTDRFWKR
jgi:hypothetical protein